MIESKVFIQGTKVTEDHLGKEVVTFFNDKGKRFWKPYEGAVGKILEVSKVTGSIWIDFEDPDFTSGWVTWEDSPFLIWKDPSMVDQKLARVEGIGQGFVRWNYNMYKDGQLGPVPGDDKGQISLIWKSREVSRMWIEWEGPAFDGSASVWQLRATPSGLLMLEKSNLLSDLGKIPSEACEHQMASHLVDRGWMDLTEYFHKPLSAHRTYSVPDHLSSLHPWLARYLMEG